MGTWAWVEELVVERALAHHGVRGALIALRRNREQEGESCSTVQI